MLYAGAVWAADAMEMMLLSFIGPAVRPAPLLYATSMPRAVGTRHAHSACRARQICTGAQLCMPWLQFLKA